MEFWFLGMAHVPYFIYNSYKFYRVQKTKQKLFLCLFYAAIHSDM